MASAVKTVGVVGSGSDAHARYVAEAVERRGAGVVLVETDRVPEFASMSWDEGSLRYAGRLLDEIGVYYLKSVVLSLPLVDPAALPHRNFRRWQDQYAAERERHSFLCSVLRTLSLRGCTLVNPVESFDLHFLKLYQVALLERHGIAVPPTLATSDPEAVRAFAGRHGAVVYKPLAGGAHVRLLEAGDLLPARLALLANSPVLFQARVVGDEYRAYVLDGEPVAAFHIPTDGVVDARDALERSSRAELPPEAWEICILGARLLGLVFTAVDLRRDADGRFVVLEFNPTPAVSYFEDPRDGRIIGRLADWLVARA